MDGNSCSLNWAKVGDGHDEDIVQERSEEMHAWGIDIWV
jgi:hypothetical protein